MAGTSGPSGWSDAIGNLLNQQTIVSSVVIRNNTENTKPASKALMLCVVDLVIKTTDSRKIPG